MEEQMHYVAAHYWVTASDERPQLGLEGFIQTGSLEEAKQYLKIKQGKTRDKVKLFKLVEVEV